MSIRKEEKNLKMTCFRLETEEKEKLEEISIAYDLTSSQILRKITKRYIKENYNKICTKNDQK